MRPAREALLVQELTQHHKAKGMTLTHQRDLLYVSRSVPLECCPTNQSAIKSQDYVLVARSDLTSTLQHWSPWTRKRTTWWPSLCMSPRSSGQSTLWEQSAIRSPAANPTAEAKTWRGRSGEKASFKIIARTTKERLCDSTLGEPRHTPRHQS